MSFINILDSTPQMTHSTTSAINEKDNRLLTSIQNKGPAPISPKPTTGAWRKSFPSNTNEQESNTTSKDPIYGNVQILQANIKKDLSMEDEGDLIERDLLVLVEQEKQKEEQKNTPPALPVKKRTTVINVPKDTNLDLDIESTTKLTHLSKTLKEKSID